MDRDFFGRLHDLTLNVINYVDVQLKRGVVQGDDLPFITSLRTSAVSIHNEAKVEIEKIDAAVPVQKPVDTE